VETAIEAAIADLQKQITGLRDQIAKSALAPLEPSESKKARREQMKKAAEALDASRSVDVSARNKASGLIAPGQLPPRVSNSKENP
jgi:hypothetical protein